MSTSEIKKKLKEIPGLPAAPTIIFKIYRLIQDPRSSLSDFERILQNDPALTAQILKIANSPYYGLPRRITNLRLALSLLGIEEIGRVVIGLILQKQLQKSFNTLSFDFNTYWQHSRQTGKLCELLAAELIPEQKMELFVCGLLHDLGKLILDRYFPDEWTEIMARYALTQDNMEAIEREIVGFDHTQIAAEFLDSWNLPDNIIEPIRCHHNPFTAEKHPKSALVLFAADRTAARLSSRNEVFESTQEIMEPDETWQQVISLFPQLNLLTDPDSHIELRWRLRRMLSWD
ncbi:MAG: HDOD domain-containing protein [Calditrichia bacterium]